MKKITLVLSALLLSCNTSAAYITTDYEEFTSKYENPTGIVEFSKTTNPAWVQNNLEFYAGESWAGGIVFETRSAGNINLFQQVVTRVKDSWEINAADIFADATLAVQLYRPQYTIGIFTSQRFIGWSPELGTDELEDALFVLNIGEAISHVDYGFTAKPPVEAPEPSALILIMVGLMGLWARKMRLAK